MSSVRLHSVLSLYDFVFRSSISFQNYISTCLFICLLLVYVGFLFKLATIGELSKHILSNIQTELKEG